MSRRLLLAAVVPIALLGCKGNPVVGNWTASSPMGNVTFTFKSDKTFTETMPGVTTANVMSGTYEVKDKEVDLTMTNFGGVTMPKGSPDQTQAATLSDDGKQLTIGPVTLTKQ